MDSVPAKAAAVGERKQDRLGKLEGEPRQRLCFVGPLEDVMLHLRRPLPSPVRPIGVCKALSSERGVGGRGAGKSCLQLLRREGFEVVKLKEDRLGLLAALAGNPSGGHPSIEVLPLETFGKAFL